MQWFTLVELTGVRDDPSKRQSAALCLASRKCTITRTLRLLNILGKLLTTLSLKIRSRSSVLVSILEGPDFVKSSLALARSLRVIDREVLQNQFSAFAEKLEELTKDISEDDLKKMDSKDIIVKFLNSEAKLFCGIELILKNVFLRFWGNPPGFLS